jgi:hypothetical protein
MNTSNNDPLATALNLTPLVPVNNIHVQMTKGNTEFETAKGNIEQLIEVGQQAFGELAFLAQQSSDGRVYRVLTEMLTSLVAANKELVEIRNIDEQTKATARLANGAPQTVNQNLIITTAELQKMLAQAKGKDEDV